MSYTFVVESNMNKDRHILVITRTVPKIGYVEEVRLHMVTEELKLLKDVIERSLPEKPGAAIGEVLKQFREESVIDRVVRVETIYKAQGELNNLNEKEFEKIREDSVDLHKEMDWCTYKVEQALCDFRKVCLKTENLNKELEERTDEIKRITKAVGDLYDYYFALHEDFHKHKGD